MSPVAIPVNFSTVPFLFLFFFESSAKTDKAVSRSSQVYSADMFYTVFKKDPMNGKEGRRYRHTVLERGGSQDEMQTLEDFLGRKPSTEAFYQELGLN